VDCQNYLRLPDWTEKPIAVLLFFGSLIALLAWLIAKLILPAVAIDSALFIDITKSGLAGALSVGLVSVVAYWVVLALTGSVTLVVMVRSVKFLADIAKDAKRDVYYWALPVLSIFAAFAVDICKEFSPLRVGNPELGRAIFGGLTMLAFFVGGLCWRRGPSVIRVVGAIFFIGPPIWILVDSMLKAHTTNVFVIFQQVDVTTGVGISILGLVFLLALALAYATRKAQV
jgi:hypothetical protein